MLGMRIYRSLAIDAVFLQQMFEEWGEEQGGLPEDYESFCDLASEALAKDWAVEQAQNRIAKYLSAFRNGSYDIQFSYLSPRNGGDGLVFKCRWMAPLGMGEVTSGKRDKYVCPVYFTCHVIPDLACGYRLRIVGGKNWDFGLLEKVEDYVQDWLNREVKYT